MTISCDIRLTPKQDRSSNKLINVFGPCSQPQRTWPTESPTSDDYVYDDYVYDLNGRKKRSEAEVKRLTISATQRITQDETNQQFSEESSQQNSFNPHCISVILLLIISM